MQREKRTIIIIIFFGYSMSFFFFGKEENNIKLATKQRVKAAPFSTQSLAINHNKGN